MSDKRPILYSYFRSSCSYRVRIALAHKGIEYNYEPVNLLKNEQNSDDYKKLNPSGQVPSFVHDGQTFTQSMSILEYLEEIFPEKPLLPKDPKVKAKVRMVCELISGIQTIQNLSVLKYVGDEKKVEWARHHISKGFTALEDVLKKTSGKYCIGNELSLADCFLVPQVYNANRFKVEMKTFPTIDGLNTKLLGIDAVKQAHPTAQIDCPEDLK